MVNSVVVLLRLKYMNSVVVLFLFLFSTFQSTTRKEFLYFT
jgi:hypothetical protein